MNRIADRCEVCLRALVEGLESRALMDAAPVADLVERPDLVSGAYVVKVRYSDDSAIDSSTLDGNDLRVVGRNGVSVDAQLVNVTRLDDGSFEAEYSVPRPTEPGKYVFAIRENEVADDTGNFVAARPLAKVRVNVDRRPPSARLTQGPELTEGRYTFEVTYRDDVGVDNDSIIDTQGVRVLGRGGFDQVAELQNIVTRPDGTKLARYAIDAPTQPGRYFIVVTGGVQDTSGNEVRPRLLGSFRVVA